MIPNSHFNPLNLPVVGIFILFCIQPAFIQTIAHYVTLQRTQIKLPFFKIIVRSSFCKNCNCDA